MTAPLAIVVFGDYMAKLWDDNLEEIKTILDTVKSSHTHLSLASIWLLATDSNPIIDNKLVYYRVSRCTKTEKLKTNHDFKLVLYAKSFNTLTDADQSMIIDEALHHFGVKYLPQTMKNNNGKDEIIKDDIGRVIYTETIETDNDGYPKWKLNKPDASVYYNMVKKYGKYNEDITNIDNAFTNKPIIKPFVAIQTDIPIVDTIEEEIEEIEPELSDNDFKVEEKSDESIDPIDSFHAKDGDREIKVD